MDDRTLFVGRGWLLDEVRAWSSGDGRVLLLTGVPGTGKSAVFERLVAVWPGPGPLGAVHRCHAQADVTRNVRRFLSSVSGQLRATLPGFDDDLDEVLAGEAGVESLRLEGQASATNVTGMQAGVYVELPSRSALDLADTLLRRPLEAWSARNPGVRPVVLVDGLDESLGYPGEANLLTPVVSLHDTVLRWVITSRRVNELEVLEDTTKRDLVADVPPGIDDVADYVAARLPDESDGGACARLRARIATGAKGVFLVAEHVIDELVDDPDRMAAALEDPEHLEMPSSLPSLYRRFLERDLRRLDAPDAAARWRDVYQPLLSRLAAAFEPGLTVGQLRYLLPGSPSRSGVVDSLAGCRQFLDAPAPDGPWHIYHQSFREFLLEGAHAITDPADTHRALANALVAEWDGRWGEADGYALDHTVAHHVAAVRAGSLPTRLAQLLAAQAVDLVGVAGFAAARGRPDEARLLDDTGLALECALLAGDSVSLTMAAGLVLWRRLQASIAAREGGGPARLAAAGLFDEAIAQARALPWDDRQVQLAVIAEAMARAGDPRLGTVIEQIDLEGPTRDGRLDGLAVSLLMHGHDDLAFTIAQRSHPSVLAGAARRLLPGAGRPGHATIDRVAMIVQRLDGWYAAQLRTPLLEAAAEVGQVASVVESWPDSALPALAEAGATTTNPTVWPLVDRRLAGDRDRLGAELAVDVARALYPGQPAAFRTWVDHTLQLARARLRTSEDAFGAAESYNQAVTLLSEVDLEAAARAATTAPEAVDSRYDRGNMLVWLAARAIELGDEPRATGFLRDAAASDESILQPDVDVAGLAELIAGGPQNERAGQLRAACRIVETELLVATSARQLRGSVPQLAKVLDSYFDRTRLATSLRGWRPERVGELVGAMTSSSAIRGVIEAGVAAGVLVGEAELDLVPFIEDPGERALALAAAAGRRRSAALFEAALAEVEDLPEIWSEPGWVENMAEAALDAGGPAVDALVTAVDGLADSEREEAAEPLADALAGRNLPTLATIEDLLALPLDPGRRGRLIVAADQVGTAAPPSPLADAAAAAAIRDALIDDCHLRGTAADADRLVNLIPDPTPHERLSMSLLRGAEPGLRSALDDVDADELDSWIVAEAGKQLASRPDLLADWLGRLGPREQMAALTKVMELPPDDSERWLPTLRAAAAQLHDECFDALVDTLHWLPASAATARAALLEDAVGSATAPDSDVDSVTAAVILQGVGLDVSIATSIAEASLKVAEEDTGEGLFAPWNDHYVNSLVPTLEAANPTPLVTRAWSAVWHASELGQRPVRRAGSPPVDYGLVALLALARGGAAISDDQIECLKEDAGRSRLGPTLMACLTAWRAADPTSSLRLLLGESLDQTAPEARRPPIYSSTLPPSRLGAALRYWPGLAETPALWGDLVCRATTTAELREATWRVHNAEMLQPLITIIDQVRTDDCTRALMNDLLDLLDQHTTGSRQAKLAARLCQTTRDESLIFDTAIVIARERGTTADMQEGLARVLTTLARPTR